MTVTTEHAGPTQAVLRRADGIELIGEMTGSGYKVPPSLVRRADGQTIQLTPLLYATLRGLDGSRTRFGSSFGRGWSFPSLLRSPEFAGGCFSGKGWRTPPMTPLSVPD